LKDRQLELKLEDGDIKALQPEIDRLAEEQRVKEEAERRIRDEEAKRRAEAERLAVKQRAKEGEDRRIREEEAKRKADAERLAEEQRAKEEEERMAREEEAKRKAEADRLAEEQRAKEEEVRRIREEEAKRKAEADRLAEEQRAKEEAERRNREEGAKRKAEADRLAEKQRAKEEAERRNREEEAKRNADAERLASERPVREQQARDQVVKQLPEQAQNQKQPELQTFSISSAVLVQEESRGLKRLLGPSWRIDLGLIQAKVYQQPLAEGIAVTMVQIPAGSFQMGSPATEAEREEVEGPQHRVQLQSFFLGQTPVTQAQWKEVASWPQVNLKLHSDPTYFKGANRPVEQVSWEEATEFCRRLSQRTNLFYTLPSEAQWEYACRAGTTSPFAFGDTLTPGFACYNAGKYMRDFYATFFLGKTVAVGSFTANAYGLQDMLGNVYEWCLDHWHDDYLGAPSDGSAWVTGGDQTIKLLRGGSWRDSPWGCRSASRDRRILDARSSDVGFRLCRFPPGPVS
jgi:formylglycine-generating enzyme required for sulfatase activity